MPAVDCVHDRGQFFVPLWLNGSAPHYFILDTGAGVSAVDATVASRLGLPTVAQAELAGPGGVLQVDRVRIAEIAPLRQGRAALELARRDLCPTRNDLSPFEVPVEGQKEAGLLGNDYLRSFVVRLRSDPPRLDIARPNDAPGAARRWIPFWLDGNGIVRVRGVLDGWMDVDLRFDSGSATMTLGGPYLNVTTPMWRALRERHPEYQIEQQIQAQAIGGQVTLDIGSIQSLTVGPLRYDGIKVVVQPEIGYFASPDAVGFIALNLFPADRWLTFDYPRGRLYL